MKATKPIYPLKHIAEGCTTAFVSVNVKETFITFLSVGHSIKEFQLHP